MKNFFNVFLEQRQNLSKLTVSLLAVSLIVLMVTTNILIQITNNDQEYESLNKNSYSLIDNLIGEKEKIFFSKPDAILKIKTFYHNLITDQSFEYGVLTKQPIYIPDLNINMKFLNGYGTRPNKYLEDNVYNSIQINSVGLNKSKINLKEGRYFQEEEYQYTKGGTLPVLLGYELREYFSLDDTMIIEYLGKEIEYKVVGFLEKDSYIVDRNRNVVFVDRYFLLPAIDYISNELMAIPDHSFQKKLYLQHTNGIIYTDLSSLAVQSKIQEYCNELELELYIIMGLPNINLFGLETKEIIIVFLAISILLLFVSIISIMLNMLSKTDMMMKNYSIHYICGAKKSTFVAYTVAEIIRAMAVAIVVVYGLQLLIFRISTINLYLLLSILLILIIPPIPSILKIYTMNIPREIRR